MTIARFSSFIPARPQAVFDFHREPGNLARISPPFPRVRLIEAPTPVCEDDLQRIELDFGVARVPWEARIARLVAPTLIEDIQESGPFRRWRHRHRIAAHPDGTWLTDEITFRFLPTVAGEFVEFWSVRPALLFMLWWRHRRTRQVLAQPD